MPGATGPAAAFAFPELRHLSRGSPHRNPRPFRAVGPRLTGKCPASAREAGGSSEGECEPFSQQGFSGNGKPSRSRFPLCSKPALMLDGLRSHRDGHPERKRVDFWDETLPVFPVTKGTASGLKGLLLSSFFFFYAGKRVNVWMCIYNTYSPISLSKRKPQSPNTLFFAFVFLA